MKHRLIGTLAAGIAAAAVIAVAVPAQAAIVFSQDFETGLGAGETVAGSFAINTTNANNNGTRMMGHPGTYGGLAYDFYQISGITAGSGTTLEFDYVISVEDEYDRFNLVAALTGTLNPPLGLLSPVSGMTYTTEVVPSAAVTKLGTVAARSQSGHAVFDLGAFAGNVIDIRFQFASDAGVNFAGVAFDDIVIADPDPVPLPASLSIVGFGLAALGLAIGRRRRF